MAKHSRIIVCKDQQDADREVIAQKCLPTVTDAKCVKTDVFDQPPDKYFDEIYDVQATPAHGQTWVVLVAVKD